MEQSGSYDNTTASLLFKVKKTQLEMVRDRGFSIEDEAQVLEADIEEFIKLYREYAEAQNMTFISALTKLYQKDNGDHVYVYYPEPVKGAKKLCKRQLHPLATLMKEHSGLKNIIIISELPFSDDALGSLKGLSYYRIEYFQYENLAYNPTKHYLVPRHEPLTRQEAQKFLRDNKLKLNQMPILSVYDPIARYYGFRVGQIIKIHRQNLFYESLVENNIFYRAVGDIPLVKPK